MEKKSDIQLNSAAGMENPKPETLRKKMPRWLKISLISLSSFVGAVFLTVIVALWLVLTPSKLTGIVNKLSSKYILCESHFRNVDLALIRTFPNIGLKVNDVLLVNPQEGAPSDTLAHIDQLVVGINAMEFLRNKNIVLEQAILDNSTASLFVDESGKSNFDIFPASTDTNESEPFQLPEIVNVKKIHVNHMNVSYLDNQHKLEARAKKLNLKLKGRVVKNNGDVDLDVDAERFLLHTKDSLGHTAVYADLSAPEFAVSGTDEIESGLNGELKLLVASADIKMGKDQLMTKEKSGKKNLLKVKLPIKGNLKDKSFDVDNGTVSLDQYDLRLDGLVQLADSVQGRDLTLNLDFATGKWQLADLLEFLPEMATAWSKGMDVDAKLQLEGCVKGIVNDGNLPKVEGRLTVAKGKFSDHKILPYDLKNISSEILANLDFSKEGKTHLDVKYLKAQTGTNHANIYGTVDDILDSMFVDAHIEGKINLPDAKPYIPESMNLKMEGKADVNLHAVTNLPQIQAMDLKNMKVDGLITMNKVNVEYDSIYAQTPKMKVDLKIPAQKQTKEFREMLTAKIICGDLKVDMPQQNIKADVKSPDLKVGISDVMDSTLPFSMICDFGLLHLNGTLDSMNADVSDIKGLFSLIPDKKDPSKVKYHIDFNNQNMMLKMNDTMNVELGGLSIKGVANYDSTKSNVLKKWSPNLDVDVKRAYVRMSQLPYTVQIPDIKFNYKPEKCEISNADIIFGNSDYYLSGLVTGLEGWISHEDMLRGDLYFTSNYTNVDDLMDALSGLGGDKDSLNAEKQAVPEAKEANPFIVPRDVDFTLHTKIKESTAFGNDLSDLAGDITIKDGVAILDQVGFVCKAARMQLTAFYKTPRFNNLFLGLDFHLLDIGISELIDMIPAIDTLVPMLASFDGNGDFHLAAETYLNAFYEPKLSTLRGAAAFSGSNLEIIDSETLNKILTLLKFEKRSDEKLKVDSLDMEMTVFRKEIELYPTLLQAHKNILCLSGRHSLDNDFNYHLELIKTPLPARLALDVNGALPNLKYNLGKCRYAELYKPEKRDDVQSMTLELKNMIRTALESNVRDDVKSLKR